MGCSFLLPGPHGQARPWRDSCAGVCSHHYFPGKKGLVGFMAGKNPPTFEVSQQPPRGPPLTPQLGPGTPAPHR